MTDINTVDQITSKVKQFGLILQQTKLVNEFDRDFALLASQQHNAPIKVIVKSVDKLYLNLNKLLLLLLGIIT